MTYLKLVARGSKRHLMKPDQLTEGTTLCGCIVTDGHALLRISRLEGDECEECAALSFQAPSQAPDGGCGRDRAFQDAEREYWMCGREEDGG